MICNMALGLSLSRFCFLQTLFLASEQAIKKSTLLITAYFCYSEKEILVSEIRDSLFFRFMNRVRDPPGVSKTQTLKTQTSDPKNSDPRVSRKLRPEELRPLDISKTQTRKTQTLWVSRKLRSEK